MAISAYSTTPATNTAISGINIAEGCPPSGINDAIRQMMADIKADALTRDGALLPNAAFNWNNQNLTNVATFGATSGNIATLNVSGQANLSGGIRGSVAGSIVVPGALSFASVGAAAGLQLVWGRDNINGREFTDVVLSQPFGTKLVMGSVIFGAPATRVYSDNGGGFLLLTLSGSTDTYTIRVLNLSAT